MIKNLVKILSGKKNTVPTTSQYAQGKDYGDLIIKFMEATKFCFTTYCMPTWVANCYIETSEKRFDFCNREGLFTISNRSRVKKEYNPFNYTSDGPFIEEASIYVKELTDESFDQLLKYMSEEIELHRIEQNKLTSDKISKFEDMIYRRNK